MSHHHSLAIAEHDESSRGDRPPLTLICNPWIQLESTDQAPPEPFLPLARPDDRAA